MLSKLIQDLQDTTPSTTEPTIGSNVTLRFSISNEVTLEPAEYEGNTVGELFQKYEEQLGVDLSRASSYKNITTGMTVDSEDDVVPGHSYKVLIMTGTKG